MPGSRAPDCEYGRDLCGRAYRENSDVVLPPGYVLLIDKPDTECNPLAFCSYQCLESMCIRQMDNAAKARRQQQKAS